MHGVERASPKRRGRVLVAHDATAGGVLLSGDGRPLAALPSGDGAVALTPDPGPSGGRGSVAISALNRPAPLLRCRWRRAWQLAAVALTIGALAFGGASFYVRATGEGTDYNVFHLAGRLVAERPHQLYEVHAPRGPTYTFLNPPAVALLMWPLSSLPIGASAVAWFLVNVGCTVHAAIILTRLLAPPGMARAFLMLTLILSLPYAVENIQLGQMHAVLLYLMVLSFAGLRRGRAATGSAWMAAATAIKLLPGIFAIYLLVRRQWRALGVFVLIFASAMTVLPWIALGPSMASTLLATFYRLQVAPYVSGESLQHPIYARTALRKTPHDQDLGALLMRHLTGEHALSGYEHVILARLDLDTVRRAMFIAFAGALAVSVIAAWPRAGDARAEPGLSDLLFALFTVLSLLLSPRNRVAYWPVLMIPWAVLLAWVMDARRPRRQRHLAAGTLGLSALLCALMIVPAGRALTVGWWGQAALAMGLLALCRAQRAAPVPSS
jgi:hypothetical protein